MKTRIIKMNFNSMLDRLKRKIVSRLTDEVDVFYYDRKNQIDDKIAKLTYKDREIILDGRDGNIKLFYKKEDEYEWKQNYSTSTRKTAVEKAKDFIRDDYMWMKTKSI